MTSATRKPTIGVQAVIVRDGRLLVIVKHYPEGTAYILPGGGQEHGETLEQAVRRECREEIGVDVTVERLLYVREYIGANHEHSATDSDEHIVNVMFACSIPGDYAPRLGSLPDPEQVNVAWLPLAELGAYNFYPKALVPRLAEPADAASYVGDIN